MKNPMELVQQVETNTNLLTHFDLKVIHRKWMKELKDVMLLVPVGKKIERKLLVELYKQGFTYKELAELSGRLVQSVRVSVSKLLTSEDIQQHKDRRSFWVMLANYIEYAYEADEAGTWEYLVAKYPDTPLPLLKQRYRQNGGTYLFSSRKRKKQQEIRLVIRSIESEISVREIAEKFDIPITTVYSRLWEGLQVQYPDYSLDELKEFYHSGNVLKLKEGWTIDTLREHTQETGNYTEPPNELDETHTSSI